MKTFLQRTISCLIIFVCLLACVSVKQVVNAETGKYSYTFTAKAISANGTTKLGDASWTIAGDGGYWGFDSNYGKGQQFGSSGKPYKTLTLSTDYFNDKNITNVTINTSGASSINATMNVTINGASIGSQKITATATSYSFSVDKKFGELAFNYTQTSSKAIYVLSITVDYEVQDEVSYTDLFTVNNTKASLNLKWSSTLEEVTGQYYWKQVTDASTLTIGNTYCIANIENAVALSTTQNNNNRGQCSIDLVDGTFGDNDSIQKITLEEGSVSGTYAFNVGNGYLYAASSSSNHLKTGSLNENASWSISIAEGNATIKANGSNTRNWLRYNSSSSLFSCYSSGQADVQLFELVSGSYEETLYSIDNLSVRFGATIEQELYEGLIVEGSSVEFGVAVAKVKDLGSTTLVDAYKANNSAVKTVSFTKEEVLDNNYTFAVLVTNVPESFFAEDFVATCYVEIDGETYFMAQKQISVLNILLAYTQSSELSEEQLDLMQKLYNTYK